MNKAPVGVVGFDEALEMVLRHSADLPVPATEISPPAETYQRGQS